MTDHPVIIPIDEATIQRKPERASLYNEISAYPAQWIRNLAAAGHVVPGTVDERSIRDLQPEDVRHATQAHFFAGIGVWSHALRAAGWPDDRPVWTGSCPCQPFSTAGRGGGIADARHLWPEWFRLIAQCQPAVILGEQVASPAGLGWFDDVRADLEGAGYAVAVADLCAASVGAPHIRQRLYFVAIANLQPGDLHAPQRGSGTGVPSGCGSAGGMAVADDGGQLANQPSSSARTVESHASRRGGTGKLGDASGERSGRDAGAVPSAQDEGDREWGAARRVVDLAGAPSPTRGFWRDADWLVCRDGKARPVEPGTFTLVDGYTRRMDGVRAPRAAQIHGYGNALCAPLATEFIRAVMEIL
jgi:DNA (cytosine-5)-methyltransferase 1